MTTTSRTRAQTWDAGDGPQRPRFGAPRRLVQLSLGYLLVPAGLQLAFWLRPLMALPAVAGLVVALPLFRPALGTDRSSRCRLPAVVGSALTLAAGAGGIFAYTGDWRKHFALLADLTTHSWPVVYDLPEGTGVLSYTVGWYLPAASVGRLAGWSAANVALSVWMAFGIALVTWWVVELVGQRAALVVFLFFSGLDLLGSMLLPKISGWPGPGPDTLEWWAGEWQIPSIMRSLLEAPQHALPTLVLAGLIMGGRVAALSMPAKLLLLAAAAVSSPFAVIATVPFVLFSRGVEPARPPKPHAVLGAAAAIFGVALLYLPRLAGPPAGVPNEVGYGFVPLSPRVADAGVANLIVAFVLVLLFEVLAFAASLARIHRDDHSTRRLIHLAAATLLLCVLFRIGLNNDLAMRGPAMALFVLAVITARTLFDKGIDLAKRGVLAVLLLVAALTGTDELKRNLTDAPAYDRYSFTSVEDTAGLLEMQVYWYPERTSLLSQYLVAPTGPTCAVLAVDRDLCGP